MYCDVTIERYMHCDVTIERYMYCDMAIERYIYCDVTTERHMYCDMAISTRKFTHNWFVCMGESIKNSSDDQMVQLGE